MQNGYRDLEAAGWTLDEATQTVIDTQYGGTYMMNLNDRLISALDLVKGNEGGVSIRVANLEAGAKDFRECTLTSIEILEPYAYSEQVAPSFVVPGGGTIGMTPEEIIGIYGEPQGRYESEGYATYTYDAEGDYLKELRFSFSDGRVDNIAYMLG